MESSRRPTSILVSPLSRSASSSVAGRGILAAASQSELVKKLHGFVACRIYGMKGVTVLARQRCSTAVLDNARHGAQRDAIRHEDKRRVGAYQRPGQRLR